MSTGGLHHKPLAYGIRMPEIKKLAKKYDMKVRAVEKLFNNLLRDVHINVTKQIRAWIKRKVPKMTGRLRFDLWSHVKDSYVRKCIIRIFIHTSVEYAKRVNEFSTANVRHVHVRKRYRGRIIILNDPAAVGHFFDKMVIFAIQRIEISIERFKVKHASKSKFSQKDLEIKKLW